MSVMKMLDTTLRRNAEDDRREAIHDAGGYVSGSGQSRHDDAVRAQLGVIQRREAAIVYRIAQTIDQDASVAVSVASLALAWCGTSFGTLEQRARMLECARGLVLLTIEAAE